MKFFPSGMDRPMMGDYVCDKRDPFRTGVVLVKQLFNVGWMIGTQEQMSPDDVLPHTETTAIINRD